MEYIDDIYVYYPIVDDEAGHFKDFNITVTFGKNPYIPEQEITKKFKIVIQEDGDERIVSESVEVKWPHELSKINPSVIKEKYKGKDKKDMSAKDKKNYRLGMKSFFSWFNWTGENQVRVQKWRRFGHFIIRGLVFECIKVLYYSIVR